MVKIKASLKYAEKIITELDNHGIITGKVDSDVRNGVFTIEVERFPVKIQSLLKTDWESIDE